MVAQIDLIRARYADPARNVLHLAPPESTVRRVRRVLGDDEVSGARILELGGGCSPHLRRYLDLGCAELVANDLLPERLAANDIHDPRYRPLPGDLLTTDLGSGYDIVSVNLMLVFLTPLMGKVLDRAYAALRPGGVLAVLGEPNYLSPLSWARIATGGSGNPCRPFNPFWLAREAAATGFAIERLKAYAGDRKWAEGNWLIGSSFAMRASRPRSIPTRP